MNKKSWTQVPVPSSSTLFLYVNIQKIAKTNNINVFGNRKAYTCMTLAPLAWLYSATDWGISNPQIPCLPS